MTSEAKEVGEVPTTPKFSCSVIAHRGASAAAPENTLEAVELGVRMDSDMIECDVHLSKDDEVIVIHDKTVDRTTDGKGYVIDFTLSELKELNAKYKGQGGFDNCRIPTLEEWILKVLKGKKIPLIEIKKGKHGIYKGLAEKIYAILRKLKCTTKVIVQSFDFEYLKILHKLDSKLVLHALSDVPQIHHDLLKTVKEFGAKSVNVHHLGASKSFCDSMHKNGLKVMVYTVDSPGLMLKLLKNGVDGIITNKPDLLNSVIKNPSAYEAVWDEYSWFGLVVTIAGSSILLATAYSFITRYRHRHLN
mmetsp:Transcript_16125/g.24324  ORF Transcript_16125/g.24324 Transcript_16125/m.24324 type:complete len:304 (+) Transcript_16125:225-1136(+)